MTTPHIDIPQDDEAENVEPSSLVPNATDESDEPTDGGE